MRKNASDRYYFHVLGKNADIEVVERHRSGEDMSGILKYAPMMWLGDGRGNFVRNVLAVFGDDFYCTLTPDTIAALKAAYDDSDTPLVMRRDVYEHQLGIFKGRLAFVLKW